MVHVVDSGIVDISGENGIECVLKVRAMRPPGTGLNAQKTVETSSARILMKQESANL